MTIPNQIRIVEKFDKSLRQKLSKSYARPTKKWEDLKCFLFSACSKVPFSCRIPYSVLSVSS